MKMPSFLKLLIKCLYFPEFYDFVWLVPENRHGFSILSQVSTFSQLWTFFIFMFPCSFLKQDFLHTWKENLWRGFVQNFYKSLYENEKNVLLLNLFWRISNKISKYSFIHIICEFCYKRLLMNNTYIEERGRRQKFQHLVFILSLLEILRSLKLFFLHTGNLDHFLYPQF